jgi:two-component system sensor histidine kinase KdpD
VEQEPTALDLAAGIVSDSVLKDRFRGVFSWRPASPRLGYAVGGLGVALITGVIFPLRRVSPAANDGVLYLLPVLLVATLWGLRVGVATGILAAAAFNFFHLPPTGQFAIADSRNLVALSVFLLTAVAASAVAALARARAREADQRRREADLAAELARMLLGGASVEGTLPLASRRLAQALQLPSASIELAVSRDGGRRRALPLTEAGKSIGSLIVPADAPPMTLERLDESVVPALEALLAGALERERLQSAVVETQALRRSDELKTALLRAISHDLRTPLMAITTAGGAMLAAELSPEERRELGAAITDESARLSKLVENLLDLSRLQAGAATPRWGWCSIEELLREAADGVAARGQAFVFSIAPDLPLVRADAAQLDRAFGNLLENALRYSGGQLVSVRARLAGQEVVVRIVDQGPGIAVDELERIFEPFHRGAAQEGVHTGSGLGLAIVRGFVQANGGRVWAESLPGQGTTLAVALPLESEPLGAEPRAGISSP